MGQLTEGVRVVGKLFGETDDGRIVAVVFVAFEEEPEDQAEAFELGKGGRLGPSLGWKFAEFKPMFEVFTEIMEAA